MNNHQTNPQEYTLIMQNEKVTENYDDKDSCLINSCSRCMSVADFLLLLLLFFIFFVILNFPLHFLLLFFVFYFLQLLEPVRPFAASTICLHFLTQTMLLHTVFIFLLVSLLTSNHALRQHILPAWFL